MSEMTAERRVLLTGATGFVAGYLHPALVAAGYRVRCTTRDVDRARARHPDWDWTQLDLHQPETIGPALQGCDSAIYLVHGLHEGAGYSERERRAAEAFHRSACEAGLERIVYLGAVAPSGPPSAHLQSRLEVGEILRSPGVSTIELRAGMIIGHGSGSWQMVRDLARRLPLMILPRWLKNHSQPVAIQDVVAALLIALGLPPGAGACLDVPGPEVLSHRELLARARRAFGKRPLMIDVPVLTPRLSCYWIYLFSRANRQMARELVEGLTSDLIAEGPGVFELAPGYERTPVDEAIRRALQDENCPELPSPQAVERMVRVAEKLTSGGSA